MVDQEIQGGNKTDIMEEVNGWAVWFNFIVEGVLLLLVACVGLAGNLASFVILLRQKVQKIFHNLLFLLSTFDTVSMFTNLAPKIFAFLDEFHFLKKCGN